jgi:uncharacterized cupredoxin-like copper-binding protein
MHDRGKLPHEFVPGTERELREHAELMKRFPTMAQDEPFMAHVAPGRKGEIVWRFTLTGTFRLPASCRVEPGTISAPTWSAPSWSADADDGPD